MNIFLDTEFNGHNGELISMALVPQEGLWWYEVAPLPNEIDPWVKQNVIPKLNKDSIDLDTMRQSLYHFLDQYNNPTIIVDWNADIAQFCNMLNNDVYTKSMHYACEFKLLCENLNVNSLFPHNALYDAIALRQAYNEKYK
jgi:hypothetical protein